MVEAQGQQLISVRHVKNCIGETWLHKDISFDVLQGEVVAIIGASGCGKTTLLRNILMLLPPNSGEIDVFGIDILNSTMKQKRHIRSRWGVMFQGGALFSSMTVYENILLPIKEFTQLADDTCRELIYMKLAAVGLNADVAKKYPAQLSGGMIKRAAVARAIALDPELIFFDEPTSGLDPESAAELDDLILHLKYNIGITVVFVTHDLDTLWRVPDKVVFVGEGEVLAVEAMQELVEITHPVIQAYFDNVRATGRRDEKKER